MESTFTLSVTQLIEIIGGIASLVSVYVSLNNKINTLQRDNVYLKEQLNKIDDRVERQDNVVNDIKADLSAIKVELKNIMSVLHKLTK